MNIRHRMIRSFVRRQGRISAAQRTALETLSERYCLTPEGGPFDFSAIFKRDAPVVLEIGFGMGDSLAQMALSSPELNFLGVEVHKPGVGSLLRQVEQQGISNIRVISEDINSFINQSIKDDSFERIQIYFPDPWPKKRHHKRRLIQQPFLECLLPKLKPGGLLHLVTDWENYAESMREVVSCFSELQPALDSEMLARIKRPETKFERRGKSLQHKIYEFLYEKRRGSRPAV